MAVLVTASHKTFHTRSWTTKLVCFYLFILAYSSHFSGLDEDTQLFFHESNQGFLFKPQQRTSPYMPEHTLQHGWNWVLEGFVGSVLKSWKFLSFNFSYMYLIISRINLYICVCVYMHLSLSCNKQKNEKDLLGPKVQLPYTEGNCIVQPWVCTQSR